MAKNPPARRVPSKYDEIIPSIPTKPEKLAQIVTNTPPRKREDWKFVKRQPRKQIRASHLRRCPALTYADPFEKLTQRSSGIVSGSFIAQPHRKFAGAPSFSLSVSQCRTRRRPTQMRCPL